MIAQDLISKINTAIIESTSTPGQASVAVCNPDGSDIGAGSSSYTPQGVTRAGAGGISSGVDLGTTPISYQDLIDDILYPYLAPTVTLSSSPSATIYEFGDTQSSVNLTATTLRRTPSVNITSVIYQRNVNSAGYTTIETEASPIAAGGAETYADSPPAPVAVSQVCTHLYRSTVGDGTSSVNSNVLTFTYLYPFYYGSGAPGLSGAAIAALTKALVAQGNSTRAFSPSSQVYYFAYPASYPNLSSIYDQNGFNITADWTLRNPVVITGLDGTSQNYKVYEFNNVTSLAQNITFNF